MDPLVDSTDFGWIADDYIRSRGDQTRVTSIVELINRHLRGEQRLLDLGTGPGEIASRLALAGLDVIGVDISREMVALASQRLGDRAIQGDIESLPFDSGEFDAAIAVWVFNHVSNLETALREVHRVLRTGGHLYFLSGIPSHPDWDELGAHLRKLDKLRLSRLTRERELLPIAQSVGFVVKSTEDWVVDYRQRPSGLADRIESRLFGHLQNVDADTWRIVVAPVVNGLRRTPSPDEHRPRQNRHQFAVLEKLP